MCQSTGETLSEFLRRIEKMLSKVVECDGLSPGLVDKVRIEQLIRGAVNSDMMLLQLRLREKGPPTFFSEIREAEESEASRHRMSAKAKAIHYHEEERASTSVIQELKAEIQELRTQICGGESKTVSTSSLVIKPKEKQIQQTGNTDNSEVQDLRKQVQNLQQQLAIMSVGSTQPSSQFPETRPKLSNSFTSLKGKLAKTRDDYFCYRCGEDGHIAKKCQAPPNSDQVIQKLICSLWQIKSEKYEIDENSRNNKSSLFLQKESDRHQ